MLNGKNSPIFAKNSGKNLRISKNVCTFALRKQKQLTIKTITIMKKAIVLAESFDPRYQSLTYTDPFSGDKIEVSGEIVDFTSHSNTYYHMTDNGDFEPRNWFDDDITHVVAECDECEDGYFEVLVPVNF